MASRSHAVFPYNFQIHVLNDKGEIFQTIGEMDNVVVARAAFEAALTQKTFSVIELREKSRVMETAKTGFYDEKTKTVPILWRKR